MASNQIKQSDKVNKGDPDPKNEPKTAADRLILKEDLKGLSPEEKASYYRDLCAHMGLDEVTKPFGVYDEGGREKLYIKAVAFDMLCAKNRVSRLRVPQQAETAKGEIIEKTFTVIGENFDQLYFVIVKAIRKIDGEEVSVEDVATVPVYEPKYVWKKSQTSDKNYREEAGHKIDENALMTAFTKAYRRAAQKLLGLGSVLLEDDVQEQRRKNADQPGVQKELNLDTGTVVGGKPSHLLDIALPSVYGGAKTLKELERYKGTDALVSLESQLKKQRDEGKIAESWRTILEVLEKYHKEVEDAESKHHPAASGGGPNKS